MTIRVRFAPSPTGYLHIGGVRTALYNWLFARKQGGSFILRIEDTDEVRSTPESVSAILESMQWLGLDWDEGPIVSEGGTISSKGTHAPYFQMERKDMYLEYAQKLIEMGKAYHCYCSTEELAQRREEAKKAGRPPKYDGRCRYISGQQKKTFEAEGRKSVVRFKNDFKDKTVFQDIVRGEIAFDNELLDDFVIIKSSGAPIYNFAVSVDDHTMEITHVVRGDDHISNTPRQIMIYKSFEWDIPHFAHIPMILGQDGGRLSKRHGAASVIAYREQGFLPEAVRNYLALLGWSTEDSQQLFSDEELIEKFSLERCSSSAAIFDPQKLLWMNGEYIRAKDGKDFYKLVTPILIKNGLLRSDATEEEMSYAYNAVLLEHEKVKLLTDVPNLVDFMLKHEIVFDEKAVKKVLQKPGALDVLNDMIERISSLEPFIAEKLEDLARIYSEEKGIKTGQVFHPLRVATSGRTQGPSLFHYMELLGKETVINRIRQAKELIVSPS